MFHFPRQLLSALAVTIVVASPSLAHAQTSVGAGVVGAVYRTSDSFELPGIGAALGELSGIEHDSRAGLDVGVGGRLSPMLRGDISFAWRPRGTMTANVGQLRNRSSSRSSTKRTSSSSTSLPFPIRWHFWRGIPTSSSSGRSRKRGAWPACGSGI